MQDQLKLSSVMVVKRSPRRLPSIRRHIFRAISVALLLAIAAWIYIALVSDPADAVPEGRVRIDPLPLPPASDTLNDDAQTLPDLLDGIVPDGENPTERLDALGNRIGGTDTMAGQKRPAVQPPQAEIGSSGPKMILIDGQPLDGAVNRTPLMRAPIAGLTRLSPFGLVPMPAPDGRKAVTAYARPFAPLSGRPSVSIIVGGLGIDAGMTQRAINELPPEVTLSFAAHTANLQTWVNKARASGHEVLMELPLESESFNASEPGAEHALRTDVSASRNIRNLDFLMSQAQGYFAVTNYNGDKLLNRADALAPILAHIADSGTGFIFDGSAPAQTLPALAASVNLPYTQAYTLIDEVPTRNAISTQFLRLEARATSGAAPIGFGFAYADTIDAINIWARALPEKNMQLAPASYALNMKR